jgi:hypothetical protein
MRQAAVVLRANELDEFGVGHQLLCELDCPGPCERFRIVHRDLDLKRAHGRPPETFRHPGARRYGRAFFIDQSLFGALQTQLGLKLESTRGRIEVLIVDHVERLSAN